MSNLSFREHSTSYACLMAILIHEEQSKISVHMASWMELHRTWPQMPSHGRQSLHLKNPSKNCWWVSVTSRQRWAWRRVHWTDPMEAAKEIGHGQALWVGWCQVFDIQVIHESFVCRHLMPLPCCMRELLTDFCYDSFLGHIGLSTFWLIQSSVCIWLWMLWKSSGLGWVHLVHTSRFTTKWFVYTQEWGQAYEPQTSTKLFVFMSMALKKNEALMNG